MSTVVVLANFNILGIMINVAKRRDIRLYSEFAAGNKFRFIQNECD